MWGPVLPAWTVLAVAGIYQLTPLKGACLKRCRTPADFLVRRLRSVAAAPRPGARPLVPAGIAAGVLVEKVAPSGDRLARLGGIVLVVLALVEGVF